jgi:hypothetical protein
MDTVPSYAVTHDMPPLTGSIKDRFTNPNPQVFSVRAELRFPVDSGTGQPILRRLASTVQSIV